MKNLYLPLNKLKFLFVMIFLFIVIFDKAQNVQLKSFIINDGLRKEILLINHYIKDLKQKKKISKEPVFVRFETGESPDGDFLNVRFLGNYYRNLSNDEELYYKANNDVIYIFDTTALNYLKNYIDFSLIKSYNNLQNYGEPKRDIGGFIVEMGELSFDISCDKFYLNLVTGMPNIDLYYKIKFSVIRGSIFYDTDSW
ncbi:hypothetical protein [Chryseobacterium polytrichastri]|uniref:Uncharacterized protein n=1 Tax=Chryseobacterium polytrichastri TaxID=1302687 RepID=A0A1M6SGK6_9FLAO|nr:hypothetical protein [Chryseobacterium polytrichastri]SHK43790.1 hypothetical protein SAMN05444267_100421 [Chryseobacterium polytrichastri]